jgi:hypothetical protein
MRTTTMRQRALLACLSPPRLSRCLVVFPDEASIGLEASSAAQDRSLPSRSGLSPAASSSPLAVSGPMPCAATSLGATARVIRRRRGVEHGQFLVEIGDPPSKGAQRQLGDRHQVVPIAGPERGADSEPLPAAQTTQLGAQLLRCGDDQVTQLVEHLSS